MGKYPFNALSAHNKTLLYFFITDFVGRKAMDINMKGNSMLNIKKRPDAFAIIKGSRDYPDIYGVAYFYQTWAGVFVSIQLEGLPMSDDVCHKPIFAAHIHSGAACTGNETDPFADAMMHYNPDNCPHPYHAGDMPPIFGADGLGFSAFLTTRFLVGQIIGKTVIIHANLDDFTTQPSGNSGKKIACGVITAMN